MEKFFSKANNKQKPSFQNILGKYFRAIWNRIYNQDKALVIIIAIIRDDTFGGKWWFEAQFVMQFPGVQ